jgi:formylglycine-generating enzyme required for sulfatase activity
MNRLTCRLALILALVGSATGWAGAIEPDADRAAAEWVIANGGTIRTAAGTFGKGDPLGDGPFEITAINLGPTNKTEDKDLVRFRDLTKLNNLSLVNTAIDDAGLKHLVGLKSLESLYQPDTKVGDAGLAHLKDMTGLVNLYLDGTKVMDAGLESLTGMTGLRVLYLRHTQISDAGLKHIKAMPGLCWVDLWGTKVTEAGVKELQAALPSCTIKNVDPKNDLPPAPRANQPADRGAGASAAPQKMGQPAGQQVDGRAAAPAEIAETFDWKREKRTRKVLVLDLGGGEMIEFVRIPAGTFQMGSPESDKTESGEKQAYAWETRHEVVMPRDYYIAKYALTKGQFARFVAAAKYRTEAEKDGQGGAGYNVTADKLEGLNRKYTWKYTGWDYTDRHPVVNVTWNDATQFCDWANSIVQDKKDGLRLSGAWSVRLPTEAEWEYSCRGGTTTRWFTGNEPGSLKGYANLADVSAKNAKAIANQFPKGWPPYAAFDDGYAFTAPVGSYKPNPFGLYDMAGNVSQWCQDPYGPEERAFRGGCWSDTARACRSANPHGFYPFYRNDNLGFRPALVPSGKLNFAHSVKHPDAAPNETVSGQLKPRGATFARVAGPGWLTIKPDGGFTGKPEEIDSGVNTWLVSVTKGDAALTFIELRIKVIGTSIFVENFKSYRGDQNAVQWQSGQKVAHSGNVTGWTKAGEHSMHALDRANRTGQSNPQNWAVMIFQDNVITSGAFAANASGQVYRIDFEASPAVYANPQQATQAGDELLIEVLRGDDQVLASHKHSPGAWTGTLQFAAGSFQYTGDGSGGVRVRIKPAGPQTSGRFHGAIDNIIVRKAERK